MLVSRDRTLKRLNEQTNLVSQLFYLRIFKMAAGRRASGLGFTEGLKIIEEKTLNCGQTNKEITRICSVKL